MTIYEYYNSPNISSTAAFLVPPSSPHDFEYMGSDWYAYLYNSRMNNTIALQAGSRELMPWMNDENGSVTQTINEMFLCKEYTYDHLWTLYTAEYNPLWNVDGTERLIIDGTERDTGTETNEAGGMDELANKTTTYDDSTGRTTNTAQQTYGKTDTRTPNLKHKLDRTETRIRGGNIGTTMTQQLEEAEIAFVKKFNFRQMVINDIISAISYPFC